MILGLTWEKDFRSSMPVKKLLEALKYIGNFYKLPQKRKRPKSSQKSPKLQKKLPTNLTKSFCRRCSCVSFDIRL